MNDFIWLISSSSLFFFFLQKDGIHLRMERWWSEGVGWSQAGVKLGIDGHALQSSCDRFVEEAEEDSADEDGEYKNDYKGANVVHSKVGGH